ncbi:membrane protein, partial [Nostoc linckia z15]
GRGAINTPEDAFNKSALTPVAVYSINDDQDSKYVFCNLDLAQELLMFSPEKVTGIEMRLAKGASETEAREALNRIFGNSLAIKNREQQNDSMYKMLNAENTVVYLFCSLVVVMTLFCLAGALIMLILDKKENIRTLHSIGAELKSLRQVFFLQGVFITSIGVAIGLLISSGVIFLQQQYSLLMITATLAYPVEFNLLNVVIVIATIYILGLIASRIAAGRVNAKLLEN